MRTVSLVQPALWLLTWSAYSRQARAELAPAHTAHDVRPLAQHPALDRNDVHLLLERARQSASDANDEDGPASVKVVRETFMVPLGSKVGRGPEGDERTGSAGTRAPTKQEEPADILRTVGKLKALRPLFTWAIHHPLRFLYHYVLIPLAKLLFVALTALLRLVFTLILAAVSPVQSLLSIAITPLFVAWSSFSALAPLWVALAGALTVGAGLGLVAGLVAGRTTREIIDDTVERTARTLRWLGVLEKKRDVGPGGFGEGARLEKVRPSAAPRARRMSDRARGKQRAPSGDLDGAPPAGTTSPRLSPLLQRFKRESSAYSAARGAGAASVDYSRQEGEARAAFVEEGDDF